MGYAHFDLSLCLNCKSGIVANFNKEKALEGAISVIVKLQTSRRFVSSSPPYPIVLLGGGRQQERGPALAQMTVSLKSPSHR